MAAGSVAASAVVGWVVLVWVAASALVVLVVASAVVVLVALVLAQTREEPAQPRHH